MLDYLKSANLASADKMVEVIQRHVEGRQRYLKRMVEHEIYEWHLRKKGWEGEVPALNFGAPKTGLEELDIATFLTKGLELGFVTGPQFVDILRQRGLTLKEPELPKQPSTVPPINLPATQEPTLPTEEPLVTQEREGGGDYDTYVVRKKRVT
jgi:hypothetical protein